MHIIVADYIYTTEGFQKDLAVAFTELIEEIDTLDVLIQKYPDAKVIRTEPHSILYPGFINTHVHLEFSANKTSLKYGSFMPWLDTVIEHRDELMGECSNAVMMHECEEMLRSGITTFGAISSFGNNCSTQLSRYLYSQASYSNPCRD